MRLPCRRHATEGAVLSAAAPREPERTTPAPEVVLQSDEGRALLETGRAQGRLDADELALALDELDLDPAQIDAFYDALDEEQIEVVVPDEAEAEAERERAWEAAEPEISTDTLQLFLKDIGKVPLLTAAQEVELAKRIETRRPLPRSRRWSRRTCVWSSRSRSGTGTRAFRSST